MVSPLNNLKTNYILRALEMMCAEYSSRGKVMRIEVNNAFKSIQTKFILKEISLITCDANRHVP